MIYTLASKEEPPHPVTVFRVAHSKLLTPLLVSLGELLSFSPILELIGFYY